MSMLGDFHLSFIPTGNATSCPCILHLLVKLFPLVPSPSLPIRLYLFLLAPLAIFYYSIRGNHFTLSSPHPNVYIP